MFCTTVLLACATSCFAQETDKDRIHELIRDLGAESAETRDAAAEELKKMGKEAVPALKNASRSSDAERALRARELLSEIARMERGKAEEAPKGPLGELRVEYHDWLRGVHLRRGPEGKIELTVPAKDEKTGKRQFKTYTAESLEQFRKEHPEIAREYDLERMIQEPTREAREAWREFKQWLGLRREGRGERGMRDWPPDEAFESYEELLAWVKDQERRLNERVQRWEERESGIRPESDRPTLGVMVTRPDPALRAQLGLEEGTGLLVREVREGSLAEKSGLQEYDLITRVIEQPVREMSQFRKDLEKALSAGKEFTLEVVRKGVRTPVTVEPQEKKSD